MKITAYREKLLELDRLKSELAKMEKSERMKKELGFINDVHKVLKKHSRSISDLAAVFPELQGGKKPKSRKARKASAQRTFKHPKTGETIKAMRTNNKMLKAWAADLGVNVESLEVK